MWLRLCHWDVDYKVLQGAFNWRHYSQRRQLLIWCIATMPTLEQQIAEPYSCIHQGIPSWLLLLVAWVEALLRSKDTTPTSPLLQLGRRRATGQLPSSTSRDSGYCSQRSQGTPTGWLRLVTATAQCDSLQEQRNYSPDDKGWSYYSMWSGDYITTGPRPHCCLVTTARSLLKLWKLLRFSSVEVEVESLPLPCWEGVWKPLQQQRQSSGFPPSSTAEGKTAWQWLLLGSSMWKNHNDRSQRYKRAQETTDDRGDCHGRSHDYGHDDMSLCVWQWSLPLGGGRETDYYRRYSTVRFWTSCGDKPKAVLVQNLAFELLISLLQTNTKNAWGPAGVCRSRKSKKLVRKLTFKMAKIGSEPILTAYDFLCIYIYTHIRIYVCMPVGQLAAPAFENEGRLPTRF